MTGIWAKHLEEAIQLLRVELLPMPGMIESQEHLLSRGRSGGFGPKVMKQAAVKLGIMMEHRIYPDTGRVRIYWRLPY
jgi:hypothetical protein